MAIPSRTTGVAFDKDGYMYMTVSYATNSSKANYISKLYKFKPNLNAPNKSNQILKGSKLKTLTLPPKAENVCVYGSYLYTIYSGSMYSSCKYPVEIFNHSVKEKSKQTDPIFKSIRPVCFLFIRSAIPHQNNKLCCST